MKLILTILCCLFSAAPAFAVSEAAVLFLLIQPSPRAAGMGHASVASFDHSPMNVIINPAHVAFAGEEHKLGAEFYASNVTLLPQFNEDDLYLKTHTFTFGHSLKNNKGNGVNIGLEYSHVYANYGEQIIREPSGPKSLGNSYESADIFTAGISIDWMIRAALGFSYKFIDSKLSIVGGEETPNKAELEAWDLGIYAEIPIIKPATGVDDGNTSPYINASAGLVRANVGDLITYIDNGQSDPIPRVSRMGIGLRGGLIQQFGERKFEILSFEYLSEAEDVLVNRMSSGPPEFNVDISYDTYGKINPFTHVFLGIGDKNVITKRGLSLELAELLSVNIGRYSDEDGNLSYSTWGFGVKLQGLLNLSHYNESNYSIIKIIRDYINLEYYYSKIDEDDNSPVAGMTYHGLRIQLF